VVHDLRDLSRVHEAQRAARHRKILRIHADRRPIDRSGADDHSVAMEHLLVHVEITRLVLDEQVVFHE